MARIETDPNYSTPTFPRADAATDLFKKEDVQQLAAAMSTHVHDGAGKGLGVMPAAASIPGTALTNGSVTLAKLAADSVDSSKIVNGSIATADLADASVTIAKTSFVAPRFYTPTLISSAPATTSTTPVVMPEVQVITTTAQPAYFLMLFSASFVLTGAAAWGYVQFFLNAAGVGPVVYVQNTPGNNISVSTTFITPTLQPAAAHTMEVRWAAATGTLTSTGFNRNLTIVSLFG